MPTLSAIPERWPESRSVPSARIFCVIVINAHALTLVSGAD